MGFKDKPLIRLNSGKQVDFVRYLFARTKIKELEAIIEAKEQALGVKDIVIEARNETIKSFKERFGKQIEIVDKTEAYKEHLQNAMHKNTLKNTRIRALNAIVSDKQEEIIKLKKQLNETSTIR